MPRSSPSIRIRNALRKHGFLGATRILASRARERLFPKPALTHHFDLNHGTDTSGLLYARKLRSGRPNDPYITAYYGTSPSLFRGVMARWQQTLVGTPYQLPDFTLIDIGCGKGRVLMMASDLPFRSIVGVELNSALAATASRNLAQWNTTPHACCDISIITADALTTPLPDSPVLLYLYSPFDEHVMQPFLNGLSVMAPSRSSPIEILYIHPVHADLFQRTAGMTLLWAGDIPISPQDTAVDAFHSTGQDVHMYRLAR